MPKRGFKAEIIKKDKKIWLDPEKEGKRRRRTDLFLKSEKSSKDTSL